MLLPRRVWLHIGTEKTGTTSIQSFLAGNRAALRRRGFMVPEAAGAENHIALTAYAQDDATIDDVRLMCGVSAPDGVAAFRSGLEAALLAETAGAGDDADVVLSNEHCSSRLAGRAEIGRLAALCARIAPETRVVVYLRHQVDMLASWYSTDVKAGRTDTLGWPLEAKLHRLLDYEALLRDWSSVFGAECLVVRRFVPADFTGGDLIEDFATAIGLDAACLVMSKRQNLSLDTDCIAFLREMNRHVPRIENGLLNPLRGPIVRLMEQMSGPARFMFAPAKAAAIDAVFAASNAAVARDFCAGRHDPLFPPARAVGPPGHVEDPAASLDATGRIAARMWRSRLKRIRKLDTDLRACRAARQAARSSAERGLVGGDGGGKTHD